MSIIKIFILENNLTALFLLFALLKLYIELPQSFVFDVLMQNAMNMWNEDEEFLRID